MSQKFCNKCGSELDANGKCTNAECVTNKGPELKDVKMDEKIVVDTSETKEVKKPVNNAVADVKKSYETYVENFKASVETEKGKLIVPDCIEPDGNEVPVKQYDIARLQSVFKGAFAEGRLQVTNKRLLFRANGISVSGPTTTQTEFSIEEVGGVEIRKEPRFNFTVTLELLLIYYLIFTIIRPIVMGVYSLDHRVFGTLLTVALASGAVFVFYLLRDKRLPRYIAMSAILAAMPIGKYFSCNSIQTLMNLIVMITFAISFLYNAFARNLVIRILSKGGSPAAEIRRKDRLFSFQHNEYTGFSQVIPGPDVDEAIKELGSVIRAIQHGQLS